MAITITKAKTGWQAGDPSVDAGQLSDQLLNLWQKHIDSDDPLRLNRAEREFIGDVVTGEIKLVGSAIDKAVQILECHAEHGDDPVAAATDVPARRYLQASRRRIIEVWESLNGEWIAGWRTNGHAGGHRFKGVPTNRSRESVQVALDQYAAQHRWPEVDAAGEQMEAPSPVTDPRSPTLVGAAVVEIPVDKIHRRPSNRGGQPIQFPDVGELMESIEALGLSNPIQVRTASEEQELPLGHYELVKGERRWTAYRALHRDTIPAIVVEGLDARQASIQAGIDNTHARPLNPIERLREIRTAVDREGCTLAEAAISRGIKPKQAEGDLRLLDLPEVMQTAIAEGRLAVSVARVMLPYRHVDPVMKRFCKAVREKESWLKRDNDGDQQLRHNVLRLVQEVTRPLDDKTSYYANYQEGEVRCAFAGQLLTDERKAEVKAIEVRINNQPALLATDVKAWRRLNEEAKAERRKADLAQREKQAKKARSEGKTANPAAEVAQDVHLDGAVYEWRSQFLRLAIAKHLVPGDYRTRRVALWVRLTAEEQYGNPLLEDDWFNCVAELRGVPSGKLEIWKTDRWDRLLASNPDSDDPTTGDDLEVCLLTQLILWPVSPQERLQDSFCGRTLAQPNDLPERLPGLEYDSLCKVADYLAGSPISELYQPWPTRIADGWKRARGRGPELAMLVKLLGLPNRRQLAGWVKDFKIDVDVSRKLEDVRAEILQVHVTPSGPGLKLPTWLSPKGKRK